MGTATEVAVRTLDGRVLRAAVATDHASVRDVRRALAQAHGLPKCTLYHNVSVIVSCELQQQQRRLCVCVCACEAALLRAVRGVRPTFTAVTAVPRASPTPPTHRRASCHPRSLCVSCSCSLATRWCVVLWQHVHGWHHTTHARTPHLLHARPPTTTPCMQTALTTCSAAVATTAREQQQRHEAAANDSADAPPQGQQQQQQAMDTLLPGYASRPNPSPIKPSRSRGVAAAAAGGGDGTSLAAAAAAAGGLGSGAAELNPLGLEGMTAEQGGGFILTPSGFSDGGDGAGSAAAGGRLPSLNSSRKRQGRTLLQEHMLMQASEQQQQQQQRAPAAASQAATNGAPPPHVRPAAAAAAPPPAAPLPPPPPPDAAAPFEHRLHHASAWSPAESAALASLALPPAVEGLLLLAASLDTCYGFLRAQHIPPSWPRLAALMARLFPQVGGGERGTGVPADGRLHSQALAQGSGNVCNPGR